LRLGAGCAADPGDAPKSVTDGSTPIAETGSPSSGTGSGTGGVVGTGDTGGVIPPGSGTGTSSGIGDSGIGDSGIDAPLPTEASTGSHDATVDSPVTPPPVDATSPSDAHDAKVAVGDGGSCLANIPASCPDCQTQNASDKPVCEMYIQCYLTNDCNPSMACGQNSGICGVNTVGGGSAPQSAAIATYNCACP
jgi:hypothetical protein